MVSPESLYYSIPHQLKQSTLATQNGKRRQGMQTGQAEPNNEKSESKATKITKKLATQNQALNKIISYYHDSEKKEQNIKKENNPPKQKTNSKKTEK